MISHNIFCSFTAIGPIRLFTPYKRRRRNFQDVEEKKPKIKRDLSLVDNDVDNTHQSSSNSHSKEDWQTLAEGLEETTEYQLIDNTDTSVDPAGKVYYKNHRCLSRS